jgi:thymidylate synthase
MSQMPIEAATLDDLMREALLFIRQEGAEVSPSRGAVLEATGVLLRLANPRARLSRSETRGRVFSSLGETLWYLAGRDDLDFIGYYVGAYRDEAVDGVIKGAYGPRLTGGNANGRTYPNQLRIVEDLLRVKPTTRRAVVQVFDGADLASERIEVPCTCTLQFLRRDDRLHAIASMRSNDVYKGLPHDVFAFTFIQELLAVALGIDVGTYTHIVGSLHLYRADESKVSDFLGEGWQPTTEAMPAMPPQDPWPLVRELLAHEERLRLAKVGLKTPIAHLPGYWADLVRLLQIYRAHKARDREAIEAAAAGLSWDGYNIFLERFRAAAPTPGTNAS